MLSWVFGWGEFILKKFHILSLEFHHLCLIQLLQLFLPVVKEMRCNAFVFAELVKLFHQLFENLIQYLIYLVSHQFCQVLDILLAL